MSKYKAVDYPTRLSYWRCEGKFIRHDRTAVHGGKGMGVAHGLEGAGNLFVDKVVRPLIGYDPDLQALADKKVDSLPRDHVV